MGDQAKPLNAVEPSRFALPTTAFRQRFDGLTRKAGIADRQHFASGWAQRKQDAYETRFEAKIEADNFLPFGVLRLAADLGRAVCKIEAAGVDWRGNCGGWVGTGFLVAPGLLLTNHHVLNTPAVAEAAQAVFSFEAAAPGAQVDQRNFVLAPEKLFITSSAVDGLDYTFVAVDGAPEKEFGVVAMFRGAFATDFMPRANIIQHPDGRPKEVVLQDNKVLPDDHPLFLHYTTDTEGGSSGAPVFDNNWQLKALHHASRKNLEQVRPADSFGPPPKRLNEGVKLSAVAADLELRLMSTGDKERQATEEVLIHFSGADSVTGYFGVRGRQRGQDAENDFEAVIEAYYGKERDIDIAFWNIEWFNRHYREKVADVAAVIADLNIDIWAFSESSPQATKALVAHMRCEFGQSFDWSASEPTASSGKQTTTVMWNTNTVRGERRDWPPEVDRQFRKHSMDFDEPVFEAIHGKIFDRYPGLFYFSSKAAGDVGQDALDLYLVPLHLKAKGEGSTRRKMASEILAAAVKHMIDEHGADRNWILGGDFNAELDSGNLDPLKLGGMTAISENDEDRGAITYLTVRHKPLIDHIFLSPNLKPRGDSEDFFILASDKRQEDFLGDISDHRPVLVRLSLKAGAVPAQPDRLIEDLVRRYSDKPADLLRLIADEVDKRGSTGCTETVFT